MRLLAPLVVLLTSWMMILDANADLLNLSSEGEGQEVSFIIFSSENLQHQQLPEQQLAQQRDLQAVPCPLGEHYDGATAQCIAVNCDSTNACTGYDETCTPTIIICAREGAICPQFTCVTSCPDYEQKDPVSGLCVPMYCSSPNACPASTGKVCLRTPADNCEAGRPCPQFKCCEDVSRCAALSCAYGRLNGPDGCPTCDCQACYGWYGMMSGNGYVGGGNGGTPKSNKTRKARGSTRRTQDCPYGHEVDTKGCPLDSCRSEPW